VYALSPQAKGRVERLWGTLQDRLVAELRLAELRTMDAANAFLPQFLAQFNTRFGVPAADPEAAYRPLPPELDLERVCCFKYEREVRSDNTITFGSRVLQLAPGRDRASWARARVEVHEQLDGSLAVLYRGRVLATTPAPLDTPTLRARTGPRLGSGPPQTPAQPPATQPAVPTPRPPWKPGSDHPWRRHMISHRRLTEEGG
jgi:hypothetical protein